MTTANYATLFLVCKLGHTCARRGPCIWDPTGRRSVWVGWGCIWSVSLQVLTRLWSHGSWHFMAFPMWSTSSTRQKTHQLPVFSSGFFRELSAPSKCYLGTKLDTVLYLQLQWTKTFWKPFCHWISALTPLYQFPSLRLPAAKTARSWSPCECIIQYGITSVTGCMLDDSSIAGFESSSQIRDRITEVSAAKRTFLYNKPTRCFDTAPVFELLIFFSVVQWWKVVSGILLMPSRQIGLTQLPTNTNSKQFYGSFGRRRTW